MLTIDALRTAAAEAELPSEREHVTPFLYTHPERFRLESVTGEEDFSDHRWTVDEAVDLALVQAVFAHFDDAAFGWREVLAFLDTAPEIARLNAGIETNEGYARSLAADGEVEG